MNVGQLVDVANVKLAPVGLLEVLHELEGGDGTIVLVLGAGGERPQPHHQLHQMRHVGQERVGSGAEGLGQASLALHSRARHLQKGSKDGRVGFRVDGLVKRIHRLNLHRVERRRPQKFDPGGEGRQ